MKQCPDCRDAQGNLIHPSSEGCNWLDGMASNDRCPHCNGPVTWFRPAPLGALLDAMSESAAEPPPKADT